MIGGLTWLGRKGEEQAEGRHEEGRDRLSRKGGSVIGTLLWIAFCVIVLATIGVFTIEGFMDNAVILLNIIICNLFFMIESGFKAFI